MGTVGISLLLAGALSLFVSCDQAPSSANGGGTTGGGTTGGGASQTVPRGSRLLGLDLSDSPASMPGYFDRVDAAKAVGVNFVTSNLAWNFIESSTPNDCVTPGTYTDPGLSVFDSTLPARNVRLMLKIPPITSGIDVRPSNLQGLPMNDALVKCRYKMMLTWMVSRIPNLDLVSFNIGNEIEFSAASNTSAFWTNYGDFYADAVIHLKGLRPTMKIGMTATLDGLIGNYGSNQAHKDLVRDALKDGLHAVSDVIIVNYYNMDSNFNTVSPATVVARMDTLMSIYNAKYPTKPVMFQEIGQHSGGTFTTGGDAAQAEFVKEVFRGWDKYSTRITALAFLRMHDVSQASADSTATTYGYPVGNPQRNAFSEYIRTLGLRTNANANKSAWTELQTQTQARSW